MASLDRGALLVLSALLLSCALLLCGTTLLLRALLLHMASLDRGALLLWHLGALLLLDRVHNVAALLLGVSRALFPGNLPGHSLTLLHGPGGALLLVLGLVVGHLPCGADRLGDCGAGGAGDCVVDCVALGGDGDCRGMVGDSNCRSVVGDSNVTVAVSVAITSPAGEAISSVPGVGLGVSLSLGEGKGGDSSKEENKLLHDYCWQGLPTAG